MGWIADVEVIGVDICSGEVFGKRCKAKAVAGSADADPFVGSVDVVAEIA